MRAEEFVTSYFDAWNHGDAKRVGQHLAADGTHCDIPIHEQHSRDEWVTSLKDFFAHNSQRYELIGDILTGRNTVAFQYRVIEADGSVAFVGAEFITLEGDIAVEIADFYEIPNATIVTPARRNPVSRRKYAKSGLSDARMEEYRQRLVELVQVEKIYLNSQLTLPKLAGLVECSVNHLSQVINSGFGMSFFEFLNHYRIEKAKQLLCDRNEAHRAILNIALEVGFNSNSAFYAAFKKACGQSPAQYRSARLNNNG